MKTHDDLGREPTPQTSSEGPPHAAGTAELAAERDESPAWPALLRSAVQNASAAIFLKDQDGRYTLVNHRFEEVVQRKSSEIIGRMIASCFPRR